MSRGRPGTCAEPGPRDLHCTENRMHDYSHYDAGEDESWNDRAPEDWQTETPHDCGDPDCQEPMSVQVANAILGLVDADRQLREPVEDLQQWKRQVEGAGEQLVVAVGDGDGTARLPEAVLAQLLLDAGWERTA